MDKPRINNLLGNVRHYLEKSREFSKDGPAVDDSNTETGALRWALYHLVEAASVIVLESQAAPQETTTDAPAHECKPMMLHGSLWIRDGVWMTTCMECGKDLIVSWVPAGSA